MRTAVVGHVEWVEFVRVPHLPRPGEIVHSERTWEEPGGGGAVAAVQLAKLSDSTVFFTALSDTDLGRRALECISRLGPRVEPAWRDTFQRRAITHIDTKGERTITVIGDRMNPSSTDVLPWGDLEDVDAVYFTGGDVGALQAARKAKVLVASARVLPLLAESKVQLDVLIGSVADESESYERGDLDPPPTLSVRTEGELGGTYELIDGTAGWYAPAQLTGSVRDAYGCGDSFAAGLAYASSAGMRVGDALDFAAICGAAVLTGDGPYERQVTSADL